MKLGSITVPAPRVTRGMVVAHGVLGGWAMALLLRGSGLVEFDLSPPPLGITTYCFRIGYPKGQDYFWYAFTILAAWGGVGFNLFFQRILARRGWRGRAEGWPAAGGIGCLLAAFVLYFVAAPAMFGAAVALAVAGFLLPWRDRGWFAEKEPGAPAEDVRPVAGPVEWLIGSAVVSVALVCDPCAGYRALDLMHEGHHLAYVQSYLAGDLPGLDVYSAYGPLYTYSLIWWMKAFGFTVMAERWYFVAVQILGTFLQLAVVRWLCRSALMAWIGAAGMLTLSTSLSIQYGWANALRTALPLAVLVMSWRAFAQGRLPLAAAAGALAGAGWLYSQEYASAAVVAVALMGATLAVRRGRPGGEEILRAAGVWAAAALATAAGLLLAIFGLRAGEALAQMAAGGSMHLLGHGALPFPRFPPLHGFRDPEFWFALQYLAALWGPAMLGGVAGGWLIAGGRRSVGGERPLAAGLLAFALLVQIPALVRPISHLLSSAPGAIALLVMLLDGAWRARDRTRWLAFALGVFLVLFGVGRVLPGVGMHASKIVCATMEVQPLARSVARLGRLRKSEKEEVRLYSFVEEIRKACPPGSRIGQTSIFGGLFCFLADRAAVPPYPSGFVVVTTLQRARALAALREAKPPAVLVTESCLDGVRFATARAGEWAYITRNYAMRARYEGVMLYVRMGDGTR